MDTLGIVRQLRADPALADELRSVLLSQDFLELPERVARLEERVAKLDERLARLEERVAKLDERVAKLDERVAQLRLDLTEMEERLTNRLNRVESDIAVLKGMGLEDRVRRDPRRYLSQVVRRPVLVSPDDFDLTALELGDAAYLRDADAVVRGEEFSSGEALALAVEVAWTAHQDDLDKVAKRAHLLARASFLPTLPVVVSQDTPAQVVVDHAQAAGIALVTPGGAPPLAEATPRRHQ
jgi:uncharacterized coiled-coil protein SlyX